MKLASNHVKFDRHMHIFAFDNRLVNLETNEDISPDPDLFILTTSGYNYIKCYDKTLKEQVLDHYVKSLPNVEVCDYYKTILATGLGGMLVPHIIIAQGCGRNGKSVLNGMAKKTCGKYAYDLPSSVFTEKVSSSANPNLANLRRKRIAVTSEPDGEMNACPWKSLTGNLVHPYRGLYEKTVGFDNTTTYFCETNGEARIKMSGDARAIIGRLRVIEFLSQFLSPEFYDVLETPDEQHIYRVVTEYNTDQYHEKVRCINFDILLPYYKKFAENSFMIPSQPEECKSFTSNY